MSLTGMFSKKQIIGMMTKYNFEVKSENFN
jgi:hypothetical protein